MGRCGCNDNADAADYRIINMICTFSVGRPLCLRDVRRHVPNFVRYTTKHFRRLQWHVPNSFSKALVYTSGKIVLIGSKSHEEVEQVAKYICDVLGNVGEIDLKVRNIVAHRNFRFTIDLNDLYEQLAADPLNARRSFAIYEPEIFSGLRYTSRRTSGGRMTIFRLGSVNITGCKSLAELDACYDEVYAMLREYANKVFSLE